MQRDGDPDGEEGDREEARPFGKAGIGERAARGIVAAVNRYFEPMPRGPDGALRRSRGTWAGGTKPIRDTGSDPGKGRTSRGVGGVGRVWSVQGKTLLTLLTLREAFFSFSGSGTPTEAGPLSSENGPGFPSAEWNLIRARGNESRGSGRLSRSSIGRKTVSRGPGKAQEERDSRHIPL